MEKNGGKKNLFQLSETDKKYKKKPLMSFINFYGFL